MTTVSDLQLGPASYGVVRTSAAEVATTWSIVSTVRSDTGYDVFVDGVRRGQIANREVSNGIAASVSPDGKYAAVITDYDGNRGTTLTLLEAGQAPRTLISGKVTSAAFSSDGAHLAYVMSGVGDATIKIGTPSSVGRTVTVVPGMDVKVLGWQSDGQALFVVAYPDRRDDVAVAPDLLRVDITRSKVEPVLISDLSQNIAYRDFRLVTVAGIQMISAIRAPSAFPCAAGATDVILVRPNGTVSQAFGSTSDAYSEAVWSNDGRQLAFTAQACVSVQEKAEGSAAKRAQAVAGTYLADAASGKSIQILKGVSAFRLSDVRNGNVLLTSERFGNRSVDAAPALAGQQPLSASALEPDTSLLTARTNRAVHIHQVYDTRDEFNGHGSCGPTSSVMSMAGYQLSDWGITVAAGGSHWSPYGRYITDSYSYLGVTYSKTQPDYAGHGAWAGAHGYMFVLGKGSYWNELQEYLNNHTGWAERAYSWDASFVRRQIDKGNLVVAGGTFRRLAHIVLIKGYTDDGGWVVNDPYGPRTSGSPGGGDQVYYVGTDMTIRNMVGN
jgi:Tol biopolymer transport system component